MFKNHLLFSVRNLTRSKGYTTVNTAGLALALAACFFIVLFVVDELRYDRFHVSHQHWCGCPGGSRRRVDHDRVVDGQLSVFSSRVRESSDGAEIRLTDLVST